jgi:hypothetical protein
LKIDDWKRKNKRFNQQFPLPLGERIKVRGADFCCLFSVICKKGDKKMRKIILSLILIAIVVFTVFSVYSYAARVKEGKCKHLEVNLKEGKILVFNKDTGKFYIHKLVGDKKIWNAFANVRKKTVAIQISQDGSKISLTK